MKIRSLSIALVFILSANADAQESLEAELSKAAAMTDNAARLAAYDAIVKRHKPAEDANQAQAAPIKKTDSTDKGAWEIVEDTSPLDDSKTIVGMLPASDEIKTKFGTDRPSMIIRYKEGQLQTYITYKAYLGHGTTEVTTRIDKKTPETKEWGISTDGKAIFAPGKPFEFEKKIQAAEDIVVRVTPYNESPVTISFKTTGINAVISAIEAEIKKMAIELAAPKKK